MVFAHDTELALQAAVTLANTAEPPESLTTVAELEAFAVEHSYTGRIDLDADELEAVRAIRPALRELLTSPQDTAVEIVNRMLRDAGALPQLVNHDGVGWHIHAVEGDRPFATRILVEAAMAMIDVIRGDELSRLSTCADPDCDDVLLDLSRNRSRRFCSTTCGNRNAVAAYRARQASDA